MRLCDKMSPKKLPVLSEESLRNSPVPIPDFSNMKVYWVGYLDVTSNLVCDRFSVIVPEISRHVIVLDTKTAEILLFNNIHPNRIITTINSSDDLDNCFNSLREEFGKATDCFTEEELEDMKEKEIRDFSESIDDFAKIHFYHVK